MQEGFFYLNRYEMLEGDILLYTRSDTKRSTYQCRLKIDGLEGYIIKSTRKRNLADASRVAYDLFLDLSYKVKNNIPICSNSFKELWTKWFSSHQSDLSIHRQKFITGTANRYFLPFFGKKFLDKFKDEDFEEYWNWRVNYWKNHLKKNPKEKEKYVKIAETPSHKTLQMEAGVLKQFFNWCLQSNKITRIPYIRPHKPSKNHVNNRRPGFSKEEFEKLKTYLDEWVYGHEKTTNLHRYQREIIRSYVLLLAYSGIRPNEAKQLKWKDIQFFNKGEKNEYVKLYISPTTKTGHRECIPHYKSIEVLKRLYQISKTKDNDDLIFSTHEGKPMKNIGKTFKKVLQEQNLLKDSWGESRTIYSLRHSYATFCLLDGIAIDDLADNMGTSINMIQKHYRHIKPEQKANSLSGY